MTEDTEDSFWLDTACGLVRIKRSELDNWIVAVDKDKDAKPSIQFVVLDTSDGVRSVVSWQSFQSTSDSVCGWQIMVFRTRWYERRRSESSSFNNLPPPVHVEQFIADRKTYDAMQTKACACLR